MSWPIFLVIVTLSWGIGNVLVKKGFQKLSPWQTYALDAIVIAFPLCVGYGIIAGGDLTTVTPLAIGTAFFITIIYALFYYTISIGQIGLTSSIIATYPIFTLILAYLFLNERLNPLSSLGILLTIIGVVLVSLPAQLNFRLEKWAFLSLLCALGYGISGYLGKLVLKNINNATYLMLLAIFQVIVVTGWWVFIKDSIPKFPLKNFSFSFLGIFLFNIGNIVYYIALEKGLASLVVPLSNTYVVVTVILSLLWLREKISFLQLVGIGSVVAGVILVGFTI